MPDPSEQDRAIEFLHDLYEGLTDRPRSVSDIRAELEAQGIDASATVERARVLALCERVGYGRVIQVAAEAWRERHPAARDICLCDPGGAPDA